MSGYSYLKIFRSACDFDHDGFSFILGGGDANDANPRIGPLSPEKPGDGIDQDGFGGDLTENRIKNFLALRGSFLNAQRIKSSSGRKKPPMILITVDTLPVENLSVYGYSRDTTPHLKALVKDGSLFSRGFSQANHTVLSFYSILRGRYPAHISREPLLYRIGAKSLLLPKIPEGEENHVLGVSNTFKDDPSASLAEILQKNGYTTIAYPNDRYSNYLSEIIGVRKGFSVNFTNDPEDKVKKETRFNDIKMTDMGIEAIRKYKDKPFFLWLHYYDHHSFEKSPVGKQWGNSPVDLYDNGISRVDEQIGRLIGALKKEGLYDKVVIAFTADHGCTFMLHKEMHGTDINQDQIHVPLIFKVPGSKAGRVIDSPAGGIDIMPTFLDYAGIRVPDSVEGWSLRPILDGNAWGINRYLFIEGWRQKVDGFPYLDKKALIFQDHILIYDRLLNAYFFKRITDKDFIDVPRHSSDPLFRRLYRDLRSWIEYQERGLP